MKERYEIQLDSEIKKKAKKKADKEGMSLSSWIRNLIINALKQ